MEKKAAIESSLVQDFVGNAHGNLDRVKELLALEPALINSCWDWGGGDFETGLGAAAHMGRRDIALYLLDNGARLDLFAAAMLGNLDINVLGPHGIPLIAHAQAGGNEAVPVYEYLKSRSGQKTEART